MSFFHSSQRRSGGRSLGLSLRHSSSVSGAALRLNLAVNCMPRKTRKGSSPKASETCRRRPAFRSFNPLQGSISSSASGSKLIALIVKSRREAASRGDIDGSPSTTKSVCFGPTFDSRRGKVISMFCPLTIKTPKERPTVSSRNFFWSVCSISSVLRPNTSISTSFAGMFSKLSRTQPPTRRARPPAA